MGTIREYKKEDGSTSYHAEIRLKGYPPQRESFRTRTLAKKWIQDTESSIRDGRHFRTAEAKKHTVKDLHLSIKYKDLGPFDDPKIMKVENYLNIFCSKDSYKHKQVIGKADGTSITHRHEIALNEEMRIKSLVGYLPDPFDKYLKDESQHSIYYFPTVSTPIAPLSSEKLQERPWEKGDKTKGLLTNTDIVIEESEEPNARINVCGFFCTPGHYPCKNETKLRSKLIRGPCMPDFGISVIFS